MSKPASTLLALVVLAFASGPGTAQEPPPADPSDLVNTLLTGLLGFQELTGPELQREVAEAGGIPFRADVPLDFMTRAELSRYVHELLDAEYPEAKARIDQRTLVAFDLLAPAELEPLQALLQRLAEFELAVFVSPAAVRGLSALDLCGPCPSRRRSPGRVPRRFPDGPGRNHCARPKHRQ